MLGGIIEKVERFLEANSPETETRIYSSIGEVKEVFERRVEYGLSIDHKHIQTKKGDFIIAYKLSLLYFSPSREDSTGSGDIKFSCTQDPENPGGDKGERLGRIAKDMIYSGIENLASENPGIQYKIRAVKNRYVFERGKEKTEFTVERNCFFVRMKGALENFVEEVKVLEGHIIREAHERFKWNKKFKQSAS